MPYYCEWAFTPTMKHHVALACRNLGASLNIWMNIIRDTTRVRHDSDKEYRMKQLSLRFTALSLFLISGGLMIWGGAPASAQLTDRTQNPNVANFGIAKSLTQEIGGGVGE